MHTLINADCLDYLNGNRRQWTTLFADPPDNIGLGYQTYKDKLPDEQYVDLLSTWLHLFVYKAKTVWFSYNAKWTFEVGRIVAEMLGRTRGLEAKPCVQTFTFGQHCHHDLGNNHRPLLRLRWFDAPLRPDAIRVPSWRQENGDKRADPRGRVPGDVFDFTRVVGNSKQRRPWHPTQLNEGLVERCVKFTTPEGEIGPRPLRRHGHDAPRLPAAGLPLHPNRDRQGLLRGDRQGTRHEAVGVHPPRLVGGRMTGESSIRLDGYRLFDERGLDRGRYRSANELATHLAFALRELDAFATRLPPTVSSPDLERALGGRGDMAAVEAKVTRMICTPCSTGF